MRPVSSSIRIQSSRPFSFRETESASLAVSTEVTGVYFWIVRLVKMSVLVARFVSGFQFSRESRTGWSGSPSNALRFGFSKR